ncbi:hypothetical protein V5F44_20265 [Xanthobacter sp. V2C-8]|uniref:hypothetical protein n=1 Tax=Xanthobacter albus TaxID=3119929 RepID=UPI00372729B1
MAGRKRKQGRRTADGRLAKAPRPVRAKAVTDVVTSQPHRRWLEADRRFDQRAESALGRLHLAGKITEPECWAGDRFRSILREFHVILASPVSMSSAAIMVAEGVEAPAEADYLTAERPETEEERRERVLAQFGAASAVFDRLEASKQVVSDIDALLMRDVVPADLGPVTTGLRALTRLWRMTEPPERVEDREVRVSGRRHEEKPGWPHDENVVDIVYK